MVTALLAFAYVAIVVADLSAPIPGDEKQTLLTQSQLSSTADVSAPMGLAAVAYDATQCHTLEELDSWRHKILDHIHKLVPKQFQDFASNSIESQYHKRKTELVTAGASVVAEDSPEVLSASAGSNNVWMNIDGTSWHAEQPRMEPQSAGEDLRHMLADVVKCKSTEELEAWRFRVREFTEKKLPPEFKPFALVDMQRHSERRLADLRQVSIAPDAQVLAQMLADVDRCTSEPELIVWRENVASHIRSHLVTRFQIPALADMQMRFDRRLDIIQNAASNPEMKTSATLESLTAEETVSPVFGFGTVTAVLGGLLLPAFMAVFAGFIRARRKVLATPLCDGGETHLLEAFA